MNARAIHDHDLPPLEFTPDAETVAHIRRHLPRASAPADNDPENVRRETAEALRHELEDSDATS